MKYWTTTTDLVPLSVGICGFPYGTPKDKNGTHNAHLCYSENRVMYEPVGGLLQHDGDTEVVDDNNTAISVHGGWTDFDNKGMTNEGVPINHHGNGIDKSIEALAFSLKQADRLESIEGIEVAKSQLSFLGAPLGETPSEANQSALASAVSSQPLKAETLVPPRTPPS
ncbi:hypothetical protein DL769_000690 [Monosporascus sp. CRB-8-3]|nr:hypothetical protein DL769_000690 [Monosporascus sp. CRB-8-3]